LLKSSANELYQKIKILVREFLEEELEEMANQYENGKKIVLEKGPKDMANQHEKDKKIVLEKGPKDMANQHEKDKKWFMSSIQSRLHMSWWRTL
jgi:hypothetical protein